VVPGAVYPGVVGWVMTDLPAGPTAAELRQIAKGPRDKTAAIIAGDRLKRMAQAARDGAMSHQFDIGASIAGPVAEYLRSLGYAVDVSPPPPGEGMAMVTVSWGEP
jgi:hypothetical protein